MPAKPATFYPTLVCCRKSWANILVPESPQQRPRVQTAVSTILEAASDSQEKTRYVKGRQQGCDIFTN